MDDLRKSYNVSKQRRRTFKIPNLLNVKLRIYRNIIITILLGFIIFKPYTIGTYVATWLSDLHVSFVSNLTVTTSDWYTLLITIFAFIVFYKLIQWRSTK